MTFNVTKLQNGFHILTYNMPFTQSAAINLMVNVGSRFEEPSESGISHFLEHMAFKGTKDRTARQIAEEFDSIGGYFNAYTSREYTTYTSKLLSENTETAISIMADIIQNSLFDEAEIAKEYSVICQEIAQTLDNPDDLAYEKFNEIGFQDQAMGRSILGTVSTISKFNTEHLRRYVDKYYHADNMILAVAGNIDHDFLVNIAQKYFHLPRLQKKQCAKAEYTGGVSLVTKPLEQNTIFIGFEGAPYSNLKTSCHAQILSLILGGGISSRIFQNIRENLGLAYSAGAFHTSYCDTGIFNLYASTSDENLQRTIDELINEVIKIRSEKVLEEELVRAKIQIRSNIIMAEEKSSHKSEEICKNFSIFGEYKSPEDILQIVNNTSAHDLITVAQSIFRGKLSMSIVGGASSSIDYINICDKLK